jgi:hypothetical protein
VSEITFFEISFLKSHFSFLIIWNLIFDQKYSCLEFIMERYGNLPIVDSIAACIVEVKVTFIQANSAAGKMNVVFGSIV